MIKSRRFWLAALASLGVLFHFFYRRQILKRPVGSAAPPAAIFPPEPDKATVSARPPRRAGEALIRPFLVAAALGLAFVAQRFLEEARPNLTVAGSLFLAAALLAAGALPPSEAEPAPAQPIPEQRGSHRWTMPLLALSLVGLVFALYLLWQKRWPEVATLAWVGALAAFAGAFATPQRPLIKRPSFGFAGLGEGALAGLIFSLAFALRFADLENLPPTVHGDEGEFALSALGFFDGRFRHPFAVGWMHFPLMSYVPRAVTMGLFGAGLFGTRIASVLLGSLSVVFFYLLLRLVFGRRVALIGAFLLAVSPPHIQFSRIGLNNIDAILVAVVAFYFLVRGLRSNHPGDFVWAGLALGLSPQVYTGAAIVPVVAAVLLGYQMLVQRGFLRRQGTNLLIMVAMAFLVFAPLGLYFWENPATFFSRTQQVNIFTEGGRAHFKSIHGTDDPWDMLRIELFNSLVTFNWRGDASTTYGFKGPMLDFLAAPLFVLGQAYSIRRLRDERHLLLLLWFWATLIMGGALTLDAPSYPRLVVLFPVVYAFVAIAADGALATFERVIPRRGRLALVLPLLLWLGAIGSADYRSYFLIFPTRDHPRNWITEIALNMRELSPQYKVYLVTEPLLYFNYGTLRFLAPEAQGQSTAKVSSLLPLEDTADKGAAFFFAMQHTDQLPQVRSWYPGGSYQFHQLSGGGAGFVSYLVSKEELQLAIR